MLALLLNDIKCNLKTVNFWILVIAVILFYITQFYQEVSTEHLSFVKQVIQNTGTVDRKAFDNTKFFGFSKKVSYDKEIKLVYSWMREDYNYQSLRRTKLLFSTNIKLDKKQLDMIKDTMDKLVPGGLLNIKINDIYNYDSLKIDVSYDTYVSMVKELDIKLGGGTRYGNIEYYMCEPKTYEDFIKNIKDMIDKKEISNHAARVLCDYLGIVLGIFPVFIGAFLLTKDKKKKTYEIIYSRKVNSAAYVISKFLSVVILICCLLVIISIHAALFSYNVTKGLNVFIDLLGYIKYTFYWLVPTVMFVVSMSMLISVLFDNRLIAILVMAVLWLISIIYLNGDYTLIKYIIRYNVVDSISEFNSYTKAILINRLFYIVISSAILAITTILFSIRRTRISSLYTYF
jgi:hypothetical protein